MSPLTTILLAVFIAGISGSNDITVGDLPAGLQAEFIDIILGTLELTGQCDTPSFTDFNLLLYTRNNPDNPIILDPQNATQIDPNKKTIILVHGYTASSTAYGIQELKNAYLQRYDCNVIIVDWSKLAWSLYTTAYCELRKVAELVGQFLCTQSAQKIILLSDLHIVGHSLGAHLSGFIGKYTKSHCGDIGRITGLDPAGPLYVGLPETERLSKSDATFVDVIHTNEIMLGLPENCGDVDFHVNCGEVQPGCPAIDLTNIPNTLVSVVTCSHLRSLDLMAESIKSNQFKARSCSSCPAICVVDIFFPTYVTMGEDCPTNPPDKVYYIPTRSSSPYALGCSPYPSGCS